MVRTLLCVLGDEDVRIAQDVSFAYSQRVQIVRRCADLAEALAVAATGGAEVVVLDEFIRGLERSIVDDFHAQGVAVVLLQGEISAGSLGADYHVQRSADTSEVVAAIEDAVITPDNVVEHRSQVQGKPGLRIAVWGPQGAPGRTTFAANLAFEISKNTGCLLLDADTYGPNLAQSIGVIEETPALLAAARLAANEMLTSEELERLLLEVKPGLRLLTGIGVPQRWPELRPPAFAQLWKELSFQMPVVVADTGFCIEADDELVFDAIAPKRNLTATEIIANSDLQIAVVKPDPISLTRLFREAERLDELGANNLRVVVNAVAPPMRPDEAIRIVQDRFEVDRVSVLPAAEDIARRASWDGKFLAEVAPKSDLANAYQQLAQEILTAVTRKSDIVQAPNRTTVIANLDQPEPESGIRRGRRVAGGRRIRH